MDGWHAGYKDAENDIPVAEYEPPEGYVLVPVEPTEAMLAEGENQREGEWENLAAIYKAMIQAAQEEE